MSGLIPSLVFLTNIIQSLFHTCIDDLISHTLKQLTIDSMSRMYTSFTLPCSGWFPPKKTTLFGSILVRKKPAQGGDPVPVMEGDVQIPIEGVWKQN